MIAQLCGNVVQVSSDDGHCVLDVSGVGYEVHMAPRLLGHLALGSSAKIHIHTHVREDVIQLYGFTRIQQRVAFRLLISVSSIGPRLAMAIVNAMEPETLFHAIVQGDASAFRGIPGVGKRTAERLIVDLGDRVKDFPLMDDNLAHLGNRDVRTEGNAEPVSSTSQRVYSALVQLGYRPLEATRAVGALQGVTERPLEQLIREALSTLSSESKL